MSQLGSQGITEDTTLRKLPEPSIVQSGVQAMRFGLDAKAALSTDFTAELNAARERIAASPPLEGGQGGAAASMLGAELLREGMTLSERATMSYADGLLVDAKQRMAAGDFRTALALLKDLLAVESGHPEGCYLLAVCLTQTGAPLDALRALAPIQNRTLDTDLTRAVARLRERIRAVAVPEAALEFMVTFGRDRAGARRRMDEIIDLIPDAGELYALLASALASVGEFDEALRVVERGVTGASGDASHLRDLAQRIRGRLVAGRLQPAIDAFRTHNYAKALAAVERLTGEWARLPIVVDLRDYLRLLRQRGGRATQVPPELPAGRVDALGFLLGGAEVTAAHAALRDERWDEAAEITGRAVDFLPRFPYAYFLLAVALLQGTVRSIGSPSQVDLESLASRLDRAAEAAAVAITDPEIEQAPAANAAIQNIRKVVAGAYASQQAQRQEARQINGAISDYQEIMDSIRDGISDATQVESALAGMRSIRSRIPAIRKLATSKNARDMVKKLQQAADRAIAQLDEIAPAASCFAEYAAIMALGQGDIDEARLREIDDRLRALRNDIDKAVKRVHRDQRARLKELRMRVDDQLHQLAGPIQVLLINDLTRMLNNTIQSLNDAGAPNRDDLRQALRQFKLIVDAARGIKTEVNDGEAKRRLSDIESAAGAAVSQLEGVLR